MTVSFGTEYDLRYTKPIWFRYKSNREYASTWAALYASLMKQVIEEYPSCFFPGMFFLPSGRRIDIVESSESSKMTSPLPLGNGLFIETNLSANSFIKRISVVASMVGLSTEDIEIHYSKSRN